MTLNELHANYEQTLKDSPDNLINYLLNSMEFLKTGDVQGWKDKFQPTLGAAQVESTTKTQTTCLSCRSTDFAEDVVQNVVVCRNCGLVSEHTLLKSDFAHCSISRARHIQRTYKHIYKRIVHFKTFVQHLAGNFKCPMTSEEENDLRHILNGHPITPNAVVVALKKLKLNKKLRKHKYQIARKLGGYKLMLFNDALTWHHMLKMFIRLEGVWRYHGKRIAPGRKIFLSYPFIFYQFCHLMNKREWLQDVQLLKNKKALTLQYAYWDEVCKITGWTPFK